MSLVNDIINDIINKQINKQTLKENIVPLQKKRKQIFFEKDSEAFASGDINKNVHKVEDQTLIDSIEANAWVYASIYKLATSVASVPFRIYYQMDDTSLKEITYEEEFKVFRSPNQWFTRFDFWEATTIYLESTGKCYWELVKGENGIIEEVYPLKPSRMEPIKDRKKFIIGWKYTLDTGKVITYNANDIVFLRYFHPNNPYEGLSPTRVAATPTTIDIYSQQYSLGFFKNSGRPDGLLIYESELHDDDYERIRRNWNKTHEGVSKAHRIAIIEQGMDYKPLSIPQKDMEFIQQRKYSRDEILACFGVPPACVGVFESAIKANAEVQERMFWTETMIPKLIKMSEAVKLAIMPIILSNTQIKNKYNLNKIYTMFDISKVFVLSEIWRAREEHIIEHVKNGTMSRNEARNILNYIYGDITKFLPFDGGNKIIVPANVTTEIGQVKSKESEEMGFIKTNRDMDILLNDLKKLPPKNNFKKQEEEDIEQTLDFNIDNPIAISTLNIKPMLVVTSIENNNIIRQIIKDGVKAGLGIKEIQAEIWDKFSSSSEFSLNRTTTIGITETTQIANASTLDAYKQSKVVSQKVWLTSRDMKVRPARKWDKGNHKVLDGQERNLDEKFSNGLMYPGEQTNKPEENVNCRCTMLSKLKENKKGKTELFLSSDNDIAKVILWKKFLRKSEINDEIIKNLFLQMFEYIGNLYIENLSKSSSNLNNINLFLIPQTTQVEFMEKQYNPLKTSLYKEWGKSELNRLV